MAYKNPAPNVTATAEDEARRIAASMYRYDNPATPYASPEQVDDAAVERFERDGFIAVENVYSPAEVAGYLAEIDEAVDCCDEDELMRRIVSFEPGTDPSTLTRAQRAARARRLFRFVEHLPALRAASAHANLTSICRRLLGEEVRMVQDMALLKPPGGGVEKPWHQDTAYFKLSTPDRVIGTWTALDPATTENGCMHVIPGSHHAGTRPHYHARDCQLPDDAVDVARDVVVPLRPGGALFFSGMVHHGTPANHSAQRRRALQFHYLGVSGLETEDPAILESLFHDRAGWAGCQGWAMKKPPRPLHLRADF